MSAFGFHPVAKPSFGRGKEKRGARGKFSKETILEIFKRDGWCCVRCGTDKDMEEIPHHVIFKSQGGLGIVENGVTICRTCHRWAHSCRAGREWFESFILSLYGKLNGVEDI
jgi:hypothetical protein